MLVSRITPQLRTRNLEDSIRFYTEKVGLTLDFRHSDFYAGIRAGDHVFHLKSSDCEDPSIAGRQSMAQPSDSRGPSNP